MYILLNVTFLCTKVDFFCLKQVDGHTNNKLHNMEFKKYPISKATFMKEGTEILVGSEYYPYCYAYDLMNDKTYQLPLPHRITNMKVRENYESCYYN